MIYSGAALEALLVWRLAKGGMFRHYPWFSFFVGYIVSQNIALFAVFYLAPDSYSRWYWGSGALQICLRFLLIWEVFRQTFPEILSAAPDGVPAGRCWELLHSSPS